MKVDFQQLKHDLQSQRKIVITTHTHPDGDAMGSSLALYHYLHKMGHQVNLIIPNDFPAFLSWMPDINRVLVYDKQTDLCDPLIAGADLIFSLDYNDFSRVDRMEASLRKADCMKVLIDHHLNPDPAFDFSISTPDTSSTAELIYQFLARLGDQSLINQAMAECIYTGMITDTGSFSYACNNRSTYDVVADLMDKNVDGERIHHLIYDTFTENRMRLLGFCINERLKILPEFRTAYIYLSQADLAAYNFQDGDTEGVVNYGLALQGIRLALFFTEKDNQTVKISLRSKGDFSVNEFARKHFNGGGHRNAAGAKSHLSLAATLDQFEALLPQYKMQLNQ